MKHPTCRRSAAQSRLNAAACAQAPGCHDNTPANAATALDAKKATTTGCEEGSINTGGRDVLQV